MNNGWWWLLTIINDEYIMIHGSLMILQPGGAS